jgi:hypothetical protein
MADLDARLTCKKPSQTIGCDDNLLYSAHSVDISCQFQLARQLHCSTVHTKLQSLANYLWLAADNNPNDLR